MSTGNRGSGVNAYAKVAAQTGVSGASPHRLILMLLEAAIGKLAKAKGYMQHGKIAEKGTHIGHAISIVDALKASLDNEAGEISQNLDSLYEYMIKRMMDANLENDTSILDEVIDLINPIREAWAAIPEDVQRRHEELMAQRDQAAAT
ncbi:MAG: flagellar export chaperone FliS [Gammaproteobacteria bacterium]|nr:flagellar export chaperone FliS [Gammaproteobacteria bacterium]MDH5801320.1 flagellar export chaperone FliS [Gammaproteobacteria bacterium]